MKKTYRKEIKYYINYIDYLNLKLKLKHLLTLDKHANPEGYFVRSLYFDNKSNSFYYDKINGVDNRKKYRIRIYNLNHYPIKFEIKSKTGHFICKESFNLRKHDIQDIIKGRYEVLLNYNNATANKLYTNFKKDSFRPVILIDYRRDAFFYEPLDLRITFDHKITKNETQLEDIFNSSIAGSNIIPDKKFILEIKFLNAIPAWIKNLLPIENFEFCAISKYALSRYIER